jgi:hypothetical protein
MDNIIAVPTAHTLAGFTSQVDRDQGLSIEGLEPGTIVTVETDHSQYRLFIVDGSSHQVRLQGGVLFPEAVPAILQGSSAARSIVRTGWIGVGLRVELLVDRQWVTTSRVRVISLSRVPALLCA